MEIEKEIKRNLSQENIIKETNLPKNKRRKIRNELSYIEYLEQPGTIYNAEVHGSAQRLLNVHRITKYVKFCKCCSLPQETPGVVVPFNISDKQTDFGLGIYLYFYYIKICFNYFNYMYRLSKCFYHYFFTTLFFRFK